MSIYLHIPTNKRTLFLRNLESVLVLSGLLGHKDKHIFRKNICSGILEVLDDYLLDQK